MTYAKKLKHPKWQKKRLDILQRDNFTCYWCGDTETTLHVHHEVYIGESPWDTPDECLTTLCEDCHEINHLVTTPVEKILLAALRSRIKIDGENVKMLNRVIKNTIEHG